MKCYKGTILTVDANDGVYRYIVEDNGIILYVGNDLPSEYAHAEIIDCTGKAIAPAFTDTHQHSTWQMHLERSVLKEQVLVN